MGAVCVRRPERAVSTPQRLMQTFRDLVGAVCTLKLPKKASRGSARAFSAPQKILKCGRCFIGSEVCVPQNACKSL